MLLSPQLNAGTTVTMTSNGRAAPEGHHQPSMATNQSDQHASDQTPPVQSNGTSRPQGQGGPAGSQVPGQPNATGPGEPGEWCATLVAMVADFVLIYSKMHIAIFTD